MNKRPVYHDENEEIIWTFTPQGNKVIFSYLDADLAIGFSYFIAGSNGGLYAATRMQGKTIKIHKIIQGRMGFEGICEHINRKRLDNRRTNLRGANKKLGLLESF